MVTQEERNAIAELYGEDDVIGTLEEMLIYGAKSELNRARNRYRLERLYAIQIKSIGFPNGPELTQAIQARKEWSEASKRVRELAKEVA